MEKDRQSLSRTARIIALSAVIVVVSGLIGWLVLWSFDIGGVRLRAYVRGHRITRTYNIFHSLAAHIHLATDFSGEQPPEDIEALMEFLKQHIPGFSGYAAAHKRSFDPNSNSVIDSWDNPVRVVVESAHNYRFISAGPNGRYEDGKADDIVYEFDPWKLAEAGEQEAEDTP